MSSFRPALTALGINAHTPDLSSGISVIVRDKTGEPTGWIKEFAAMHALARLLVPPPAEFSARLAKQLAYLASHGVTTLFDAGNLGLEDTVYGELAALDRAGKLPVRFSATTISGIRRRSTVLTRSREVG